MDDPVRARRARIARATAWGKRIGYTLLVVAILAFVIAALSGFPRWAVVTTIAALIGACIVLPVPIVIAYGLRAAEREDPGPD